MTREQLWPLVRTLWRLRRQLPTFVSFNVTNRCSERCPMCAVWRGDAEELSLAEMEPILRELHRFGLTVLEVSGGEPFLRDDIFEVFSLLERIGFLYSVTTNGTVFPDNLSERLCGLRRILQLAVSLDSLDRETYARLRGNDLLPAVLDNISRLAVADLPMPRKLNVAVSRLNYREIPALLNYAKGLGFYLSVFPVAVGEGFAHRNADPLFQACEAEALEMAALFRELARLRRSGEPLWEYSGFYELAADFVLGRPLPDCAAGRLFVDIHSDGTLAACVDQVAFADLRRESIYQAWSRLAQQKEGIRSCTHLTPCCYTCTYNVALTARNLPRFLLETVFMMLKMRFKPTRNAQIRV